MCSWLRWVTRYSSDHLNSKQLQTNLISSSIPSSTHLCAFYILCSCMSLLNCVPNQPSHMAAPFTAFFSLTMNLYSITPYSFHSSRTFPPSKPTSSVTTKPQLSYNLLPSKLASTKALTPSYTIHQHMLISYHNSNLHKS